MNFEIFIDGKRFVNIDFDLSTLLNVIRDAWPGTNLDEYRSTPASVEQMGQLLVRVDEKSKILLTTIAMSEEGSVSWSEMRSIFEIKKKSDWAAYSGKFGRGITRAYRSILGDKTAQLIWWIDEDWSNHEWDSDMCCVYVDGQALNSLRAASVA